MHSVKLLSALAAVSVGLASGASTCTKDVHITEPTPVIDCEVIDADLIVDEHVAGDLVIEGPKQLKGDFTINGAQNLTSLSSSSINAIGGNFSLTSLDKLGMINLGSVKTLNSLSFITLPAITRLMLGTTGLTKATSITVIDTFLNDMSQLNVASVEDMTITSNRRVKTFNSDLKNITGKLIIVQNAKELEITMDDLESAGEFQIGNVKSFEAPKLQKMTSSLKFEDNPSLTSFAAPNLTKVTGDISFQHNDMLKNISMPKVTSISSLTVSNNSALKAIDGFDSLETVNGAIVLAGVFKKVELPKLDDVKGSVTVTSTTDISDFCDFFDEAKDSGKIQGKKKCTSENKEANSGGDGGDGGKEGGSGNSESSDSEDDDGAAGMISVNMGVLGLAVVAGLMQLF